MNKRIHICLFDKECWRSWKLYAMPMRIYWGNRFFTIPGLSGKRRFNKMWETVWKKDKATGEWVKKQYDKKTKSYIETKRVPDNNSSFPWGLEDD